MLPLYFDSFTLFCFYETFQKNQTTCHGSQNETSFQHSINCDRHYWLMEKAKTKDDCS